MTTCCRSLSLSSQLPFKRHCRTKDYAPFTPMQASLMPRPSHHVTARMHQGLRAFPVAGRTRQEKRAVQPSSSRAPSAAPRSSSHESIDADAASHLAS